MGQTPLRFLVVEDEVILAMDIEGMIEDAGHKVVGEAASLAAFGALADDLKPDVALVDIHLAEGSSGIVVSTLIQTRWPDAIVVFVTANPSTIPDDYAGAYGVVAKPFSYSSFMSVITYVCEGVSDPPPETQMPKGFEPSPKGMAAWS